MKFYKIPLHEKYENYDVQLRVILFFNPDGSMSLRVTTQALIACETWPTGEMCSYKALSDSWAKTNYELNKTITIGKLGTIEWKDESSENRGFVLTFAKDYAIESVRNLSFLGGMVTVNFDQNAQNTLNICKKPN
jgi:hypothetical protein